MNFSWLAKPLQWVPQPLTATTLGVTANLFLRRYPVLRSRLRELDGKTFEFAVDDFGQSYFMTVVGGEVRIHGYLDQEPHVVMAGTSEAFLALLFQTVDPDSLFFSRRLKLSGETDTGLAFKNILNNLEIDWEADLALFLGRPIARMLIGMAKRTDQGWEWVKQQLDESTDTWLKEEGLPRQLELERLRQESTRLGESLDRLDDRISRAGKRLALARSPRPGPDDAAEAPAR